MKKPVAVEGWKTSDGKVFQDEGEARAYEAQLTIAEWLDRETGSPRMHFDAKGILELLMRGARELEEPIRVLAEEMVSKPKAIEETADEQ